MTLLLLATATAPLLTTFHRIGQRRGLSSNDIIIETHHLLAASRYGHYIAAIRVDVATAPLDSQFFIKVGLCNNNSRFNHHLTNGDINTINKGSDLCKFCGRVRDDYRISSLIHYHRSTLGYQRTSLLGTGFKQLNNIRRLGIANANKLGLQWRQLRDLLVGFDLLTLPLSDLLSWCNHQHVADLPAIKPLGFENQLERLIPRDILQTQCDTARYGIRCN